MGEIDNNNIILLLKSDSGRLLSIFLKAMVMGEAIAKLTLITKGATIENSMSYVFAQSTYSSFAVQAFVFAKGASICDANSNMAQVDGLLSIDW